MKVSIISTYEKSGGAGIAANRLYEALSEYNVVSVNKSYRYSTSRKNKIEDHFLSRGDEKKENEILAKYQRYLIAKNRTPLTNTLFSGETTAWDISNLTKIKESNVINIHWVSEFMNSRSIHSLAKLNIPIVWTLHDESAFTGGCHYTYGCDGFKDECSDCSQLRSHLHWLPEKNLQRKAEIFCHIPIHFVTPSVWLKDRLVASRVFDNAFHKASVIRYSLDLDIFKPVSETRKNEIRRENGLNEKNIYILIGCFSWAEERKGFKFLLDALVQFSKTVKEILPESKVTLLSLGNGNIEIEGFENKSFGFLSNEKDISKVICMADIFLNMSREDNSPNMVMESLACGVPVISTNVGGIPEMYENEKSGTFVTRDDYKSMNDALGYLMKNPDILVHYRQNARAEAVKKFAPKIQARKYLELFSKTLMHQNQKIGKSNENLSSNSNANKSSRRSPTRLPAMDYFPDEAYLDRAKRWLEERAQL